MSAPFTYIWEFRVPAWAETEFLSHYGPGGSWERLFRGAPGFVDTILLKEPAGAGRYVTIDRWDSEVAYQAFRRDFAGEYAALDRLCEALTTSETHLGSFDEVTGAEPP